MSLSAQEKRSGLAHASAPAWFYVEPNTGQVTGPVNAQQLAGLLDSACITIDTPVWEEGRAAWASLQECSDLYNQVYLISASGSSAMPADSGTLKAAAITSQPSPTGENDELTKFNEELALLGENQVEQATVNIADSIGQDSSAPEEQGFTDDDGTVYEWNPALRKFQPRSETVKDLPENYALEEMTFQADEEVQPAFDVPAEDSEDEKNSDAEEVTPAEAIPEKKGLAHSKGKGKHKRTADDVLQREQEKMKRARQQAESEKSWFDLKVNTSIYVSGLPQDVDEAQLAERFSQYGVIKASEDGAPRVKVYRDKVTQLPKGDGLITYLYEPSVELACKLADDDCFRVDLPEKMSVQPAKFEMRGNEYVPKKRGKRNKNSKDKAKLNKQVLGWEGFDDSVKPAQVTVILKNLFHPNEIIEDPALAKDLESDVRTECSRLGEVTKIRVFTGHPQGVISVRFKTLDATNKCIETMHGRFFGGKQVEASLWDGFTNYNIKLQESEEQIAARRAKFAADIEAQQLQEDLHTEPGSTNSLVTNLSRQQEKGAEYQ